MEEVVEQAVDSAADVVAGRSGTSNLGHLAIVSAVAFGTGAGLTWLVAKRYFTSKYEQILEEERVATRDLYARLYKTDEFATPGDAAEALGVETTAAKAAGAALERYGATKLAEVEGVVQVTETVEVEVTPVDDGPTEAEVAVARNVFTEAEPTDEVWDQDLEEAKRAELIDGEPYIISHMEYNENEHDHEQTRLTYYAEDDVLVDEKESPIEADIDMVVGEDNLTRFGHGTMDNRMVYIRNHRLSMDFEVVKHDGAYSKVVLGFQHADGPRIRKMRRDVE